jgi:cell wall-associated NlpC family hydrolase
MKALAALFVMFALAGAGTAASTTGSPTTFVGGVVGGDVDAMLPAGFSNPRTAQEAVTWALGQVGVFRDSGHCLRFVDLAYGRTSGPPSAHMVWTLGPPALRHAGGNAPRGAVVVWSSAIGGGHGHIAISLGDGRMVSTTDGAISILPIRGFADSAYLGWMPPYFYM